MEMPPSLITVTKVSKAVALILFVFLPFLGFCIGIKYQTYVTRNERAMDCWEFVNEECVVKNAVKNQKGITFVKAVDKCSPANLSYDKNKLESFEIYRNDEYDFEFKYPSNLEISYVVNQDKSINEDFFSLRTEGEVSSSKLMAEEAAEFAARGETPPGRGLPPSKIMFRITSNPNGEVFGGSRVYMAPGIEGMFVTSTIEECGTVVAPFGKNGQNGKKGVIIYNEPGMVFRDVFVLPLGEDVFFTLAVYSAINQEEGIIDMIVDNLVFDAQ